MRIGFIGNFRVPYSTECEREWSFKKLGHEVVKFQENQTTAQQLRDAMSGLGMLVYSHTHDPAYVIRGLREVFEDYKAAGVPTVSVHLDRWLWLKRVADVGKEATWFTEHIFMADASPEAADLYDELGLKWHYLRPAVVERDCYMAAPDRDRFPHEIIFTGSRGYHPEYSFRATLVDWLKETYGDRFGHYGNDGIRTLRQHDLNVALASAKIVVGDSCFGGRPNYVSDRYYEVRGRFGCLLHGQVDGVDSHGVGHYLTASEVGADRALASLQEQIEYWLAHDDERESMRRTGFEWVKNNETYTHRAQEILDTVFA
ncbi:glycosyltransferase [Nocardia aurea]|uniref:glycosyltransferase n=1 Tax=Nocardia aurea TaxID=2144174 RepID=UPI0033B64352